MNCLKQYNNTNVWKHCSYFRHFVAVGLLKMGWKKLYLFNKKGLRTEAMVYCLLDFYIHETKQRNGYGIKLMEYMLKVKKNV